MKKYSIALLSVCLLAVSCNDFLTRENPNSIESEYFFKDETSLVIYTNTLTRSWVPAIIDFVNGDRYTDTHGWDGLYNFYTDKYDVGDMTSWSWSFLRSVNYYLEHMGEAKVDKAIHDHYEGVGHFFRAMFYIGKVQQIGACPYYDHVIDPKNKDDLYKARDSRSFVCSKILEDLNYACEHCSGDAQYRTRSTYVNKYVALAYKARFCLFEGTYRKYHDIDHSTGKPWTAAEKEEGNMYLNECVKACEEIMNSGIYGLIDNPAKRSTQYRDLFTNEDGCANLTKEFIWARDYDATYQVNNTKYSINDYMLNAQHAQYAFNRDFVMTYLMLDGTPFTSKYSGTDYYKATFKEECTGRDLRLAQTMRTPGFTRNGGKVHYAPDLVYSKTGYQPIKWLYDRVDLDEINSATYTDVPLMRYAEVLLSYAEAKAELGQCTEEVWNASVKLVRERAGVKSIYPVTADPYMAAYFPGVTDPKILEIRRERGIEFTMENLRQQDIRRWHMGELLVKQKTGMWIPAIETELDLDGAGVADSMVSAKLTEKAGINVLTINYNGSTLSGTDHRLSEGDHGYILPYQANRAQYNWSEKKYLYPVPASSVTMNDNLDQNAGW